MATASMDRQVLAVGVRGIGMALRFAFGPVGLLISAAALGFGYLWEKCDWFREGFLAMWEGLKSVPGELAEAFSGAMGELGESIGQFFEKIPGFSQVRDFFKDSFSGLKNFIGLGDDEKAKVEAKPVVNQAASSPEAASSTAASAPPSANAGASGAIPASAPAASAPALPAMGGGSGTAVSMSFTLNGISDSSFAKRVVAALESNRGAFERIISDIVHDQERLAYGG